MEGYVELKLLRHDRHQDIDADSDPNLRRHSVLAGAVEALDAQALLIPTWRSNSSCHRTRETGCLWLALAKANWLVRQIRFLPVLQIA